MGNNSHKPAIRFQGFTDAWEQRKLGDMAEIIGGGTPSTANTSYWDGDIDWYAPAEIADQIYVSSSQRKITKEGYENSSAKMLPVGTVLFTSRAGIGKTAILSKESCTNQGFQSIVPNKELLDSYFIFSRTDELKNYGETVGAGSTFVEVSGKQMAQMTLMMPTSLAEQQKIGDFFERLDNLITLHQRKYEKLITVKKSMLEKMFPRDDSNNPEIRFTGFTDRWEQRKLQDVTDAFKSGSFIATADIKENGEYPVYGGNGLRGYSSTYNHDGEFALIGRQGALCGNMNYSTGKAYFTEHAVAVKANSSSNTRFLYYLLDTMNLGQYSDQSAQPGLAVGKLVKMENMFPSKKEQDQIGAFFFSLDNLITLHHLKLEKLKNIKQSLLQNMFV